jgi:Trypsin-like peptidase domain
MRKLAATVACLTMSAALPAFAQGDANPPTPWLQSKDVGVNADSGLVWADADEQVVFSTDVVVDGAPWLRLRFDEAMLAGTPGTPDGAYLRITAHLDGAVQFLDAVHVAQWRNTSAYFNGDAVTIDLVAFKGTGPSRLVITSVIAGVQPVGVESICGATDDRVLSDDPRAARILPIGCTGWLIDDCQHCMLTAGHCQGGIGVVEFNVPLSDPEGGVIHPPPEDQYAIDPTSLQGNGGQGVGDDWAYYGCFPNANTGLTPAEAQGDVFELADVQPPVQGQNIRITGYGSTSPPVPNEWNLVQKTHAGPFVTSNGSLVQYQTDTTGGNSGSPVIDDSTGLAIGIHTHAGCSLDGGANSGTGISHPGLMAALADPHGICQCPGLAFQFPDGLPDFVDPAGGTTLLVSVGADGGLQPVDGTGMFHYDAGDGYVSVAMDAVGANMYHAVFTEAPCLTPISFYVSAEADDGQTYTSPAGAPDQAYLTIAATDVQTVAQFDLETDPAWTIGAPDDTATTGIWVLANPIGTIAQPENDHTVGGTDCYFTGQGTIGGGDGDNDVDGGKTTLTTAPFDLSGLDPADLSYWRWYDNSKGPGPNADVFVVDASDDAGKTWVNLETVGPDGPDVAGGWILASVRLTDFIDPTDSVLIRFVASDNDAPSLIEAAIDDVRIDALICDEQCKVDFNHDGALNILDFVAFQTAFANADPDADFNGDGALNILDFVAFQVAFVAGCG